VGEICNACVLLVKRWKKLPKNTKRDWSHVVDARAGPGTKSFVKQKKKDDNSEEFEKIRRKHFLKKISRTEIEDDESERRSVSPLDTSSQPTETLSDISSARLQDNTINDFFDSYYWKRETGCCGVIYRGMMGEVMVDTRIYSRCAKHTDKSDKTEDDVTENNNNNDNDVHMTVESLIESELRKLTEERKSDPGPETVKESDEPVKIVTDDGVINDKQVGVSDPDEGFCDKSSTVTGPSSPDSTNLVLEDE